MENKRSRTGGAPATVQPSEKAAQSRPQVLQRTGRSTSSGPLAAEVSSAMSAIPALVSQKFQRGAREGAGPTKPFKSEEQSSEAVRTLAEHVRQLRQKKQEEGSVRTTESSADNGLRRPHKNAPAVMDAGGKLSTRNARQVVSQRVAKPVDPRFDPLCGRFDENVFEQRYSFLRDLRRKALDEAKIKLAALEKRLKIAHESERDTLRSLHKELRSEVDRRQNQVRRDEVTESFQALLRRHKREETEQLAAGRKTRPFFWKRSMIRDQLQKERDASMKKHRGWKRHLERREREAAAKDRKLLRDSV
ncbi:hypothetical protein CYME_CMK102C [Cyanidioschyzon merolae strain 10D]|uniref:rRNA biogenesis protein RRP36 n=1 Tax=Cyanidioschyzon merolae (strain NIES-3377 / 10D) TaxID=280699 RepID=M1VHR6_CYAM1|nr:hypothetical protein CYME_CMK102C [Cyanidioschyzon merolae strain 10D]BAM80488.1 hypothetical protein CYME_CMK102C [Cyanidioschyzon merolae strain 10D]|eukprot:XP_005536524.1 hypothetical protein CYME_CMK102C [Cyanidioschyzon merolae strain 10D]